MFSEIFFIFLTGLLQIAGIVVLLLFWWPYRRTQLLSAIPWICLFLIYLNFFSSLEKPIWEAYAQAAKASAESKKFFQGNSISLYSIAAIMLRELRIFLIILMATVNSAFLLQSFAPENRLLTMLSRLHRFQPVGGVCLLIAAVAPVIMAFMCTRLLLQ